MDGRREDPWRHLGSESGSGGDIAELIRRIGTADGGEQRDALDQLGLELGGEILRPAVEPAVPLLIEMVRGDLAARPEPVLRMLARLVPPPGERDLRAEADQGYAGAPPQVDPLRPVLRGLLAEQLTGLLGLIRDPDPRLRAAAARLVAGLPDKAAESLPALRRAADRDPDPVARASLVLAVAALVRDAPGAAGAGPDPAAWLAARLADSEPPLVRTAAAVGAAWLGRAPDPVRPVLRAAAAQPPPGLDDGFAWAECGPDAFLAAALPDDQPFAVELVHAAGSAADPQRRHEAVCAGKEVMRRWRAAPPAVVAVLAPLAADPEPRVRQHAAQTLALAGAATGLVGDLLAELVEAAEPGDRDEALPPVTASARYGLARLGDPRCLPALRRSLAGPEPADWLAESLAGMSRYADALLDDVDRALTGGADPLRRAAVVSGLRAWGGRAAPLAGTLLGLTYDAQWTDAPGCLPGLLGALGPRAEPAVPYLRALLRHDLPGVRAVAAVALWRVTGEVDRALATLRGLLADGGPGLYLAADAAERLGPAARPLADDLAGLLDPRAVAGRTRVAAARALLAVVGPDPAARSTLIDAAGPDEAGVRAIQALAWIGPAAAEVLPVLEPMAFSDRRIPHCNGDLAVLRDEGWQRLARLALARISPAGGGAG